MMTHLRIANIGVQIDLALGAFLVGLWDLAQYRMSNALSLAEDMGPNTTALTEALAAAMPAR